MGFSDPSQKIYFTAFIIDIIGFSSATQDIFIDAYRIESAPSNFQNAMASSYIIAYRLSIITSRADHY
jgi:PAT family beta-lactamase induction signal transducer AmpG